jgi:hypothetical protein
MGDTIQTVNWALERKCPLRDSHDSAVLPSAASASVGLAKSYGYWLRRQKDKFGLFGDVVVSSHTFGDRPGGRANGPLPIYPIGGFVVSKSFANVGGPEALFKICHGCPANIRSHDIAGCVGSIFQRPDSAETEAQLRGIVSRLGLQRDIEESFPSTTPLWYGLWAVSPIPANSLPVLIAHSAKLLGNSNAGNANIPRNSIPAAYVARDFRRPKLPQAGGTNGIERISAKSSATKRFDDLREIIWWLAAKPSKRPKASSRKRKPDISDSSRGRALSTNWKSAASAFWRNTYSPIWPVCLSPCQNFLTG